MPPTDPTPSPKFHCLAGICSCFCIKLIILLLIRHNYISVNLINYCYMIYDIYDNCEPKIYCTGCTQKNGAVSEVSKKFISHLTRAQRTPSAAATVQVSHALPAVRFSCLLRGQFTVYKMASQKEKAFCVLRFEVARSVIIVHVAL